MNVLIIEDSISFALDLEMKLVKLGHTVVGPAIDNAKEALAVIKATLPDLIMMDIHLNGKEKGTELAEKINHLSIPIIFMTSHLEEENYLEAKKISRFAYMIKEFQDFELENTIDLLCHKKVLKDILFLKKGDAFYKVKVEDILYVKSEGNYCTIFLEGNNKFINRVSISSIETLFQTQEFIRPHRSYLVNVHKIDSLRLAESLIYIQDHQIPITRGSKATIFERYMMLR